MIVAPELEICDPHHHLWDLRNRALSPFLSQMRVAKAAYLLPELLHDLAQGHNVTSTVFVESRAFYNPHYPDHLQSVGETQFAGGIAAMSAGGAYGGVLACEGIVARVDLTLGDKVEEALEAQLRAGGGRLRGVRQTAAHDEDSAIPRNPSGAPRDLYRLRRFREGFARLQRHNLSFDAWLYHPQLDDLIDLARAFANQTIILDHLGTPLGVGAYHARRAEVYGEWRSSMRRLAQCPNVFVKVGGLGMQLCGFDPPLPHEDPVEHFAVAWAPYLDACIEAFGAARCMFESNFPVDAPTCGYRTLWNIFKTFTRAFSSAEQNALYRLTARRVYRLGPARSSAPQVTAIKLVRS